MAVTDFLPAEHGSFPTRSILGIPFFAGDLDCAIASAIRGGLILAPSGPGLAVDLCRDQAYATALHSADLILPDSGLMSLWWNFLYGKKEGRINRISGLLFLKNFISTQLGSLMQDSFWIMPNRSQDTANRQWLASAHGLSVSDDHVYVAPIYEDSGPIEDPLLLELLAEKHYRVVIINLGGGVQERLGLFLRENLPNRPTILCTGAALAFLSGQQVQIPSWADRSSLGWLFRCFSHPARFVPRYWRARKLLGLLLRHGSESPLGK